MTDQYSISVVIATRNRPSKLENCLRSISQQESVPAEVVVVDDGTNSLASDVMRSLLPATVQLEVTTSAGPTSTSTARNTGARVASSSIVLFLDDDVVLAPSYINRLREMYKSLDSSDLAGIGGYDDELRTPSWVEELYNSLFYLAEGRWRINSCGMQSWGHVSGTTAADWLSGNNASYKRSVLVDHPFPHWEGGREALEDIAMGWRLKRAGYRLLIDPGLTVDHDETGITEGDFAFGVKRGKNRIRIFRNWGRQILWPLFVWAYFGETLRQFLAPAVDGDVRAHWQIGCGMIAAPFVFLLGVLNQ
ncbi:glycosyltransferase family 2 protein [Haloarcula brevis]|uniref:glycosyltransferase family 2 protein n=1 Tax=Haloarcula brevis TaxID=3111453 RepID=UPI00300E71EA